MFRSLAGLCLVGLGLLSSALALAAPPLVAVTESPANTAPRALRLEIRPTVEATLRDRGVALVARARLSGDLAKCAGEACVVRVGTVTGATHVLVVDSSYVDDGYRMRLRIFDARTGRELYSDGQICEVCTHDDFTRALRERTAILWSRIQAEEKPPAPAPDAISIPAPPVASSPAGVVSASPNPAPSVSLARRLVGPILVTAGVAAAVVGGAYVAKDGGADQDHAGCHDALPCPYSRRTLAWSAPLVGVGVVAALLGGYFWWTTPSGTAVTASVGPGGLSVFGVF